MDMFFIVKSFGIWFIKCKWNFYDVDFYVRICMKDVVFLKNCRLRVLLFVFKICLKLFLILLFLLFVIWKWNYILLG